MKKIRLLLVVLWLILIFLFSSSNGTQSNNKSKELINKGIIIYEKITNKNIDNQVVINNLNYPLRKFAHFTIFFILGILIYLFLYDSSINNKLIVCVLICFIFACFDEIHQVFTGGRTPKILDVFIDTLGSFFSIFILNYKRKKVRTYNISKTCKK